MGDGKVKGPLEPITYGLANHRSSLDLALRPVQNLVGFSRRKERKKSKCGVQGIDLGAVRQLGENGETQEQVAHGEKELKLATPGRAVASVQYFRIQAHFYGKFLSAFRIFHKAGTGENTVQ